MTAPKEGDLKAGVTGMIIGAAILFVAMTAIVHFTNTHYDAEKPAADAPKAAT
jgi:hypothetical protein